MYYLNDDRHCSHVRLKTLWMNQQTVGYLNEIKFTFCVYPLLIQSNNYSLLCILQVCFAVVQQLVCFTVSIHFMMNLSESLNKKCNNNKKSSVEGEKTARSFPVKQKTLPCASNLVWQKIPDRKKKIKRNSRLCNVSKSKRDFAYMFYYTQGQKLFLLQKTKQNSSLPLFL